jgi:quinol monooxygenase YgiN
MLSRKHGKKNSNRPYLSIVEVRVASFQIYNWVSGLRLSLLISMSVLCLGANMTEKITVVARFKAKDGMEKKLRELLLTLINPSRSDDGCINYDLHQSIEDPAIFIFYENWSSREHLDKHGSTAHIRAFRSKATDLLAEPPELTLLEMISGK